MPEIISNPATEKKKKKKDKKSIADIQVYVLITTHHFPLGRLLFSAPCLNTSSVASSILTSPPILAHTKLLPGSRKPVTRVPLTL